MRLIFLILGTLFTLIFILLLNKGKKLDYMLESIDGDAFPLKSIYSVGLALQSEEKFLKSVNESVLDTLKSNTKLYYSKQYEEYYARIILAQVVSFVLFFLAVGFSLAALVGGDMGTIFAVIGVVMAILSGYYFYNYTRDKITQRKDECDIEFPDAITKLALIVNSGVILHDAWRIVADGNTGVFYDLMKKSCEKMDNGKSDVEAIREFGILTNSDEIKKFTTALIQSIERGGGDLPSFLINQTTELMKLKRQLMLQKGEKAASSLLIPIALMFAGVMFIVLASAMQGMSF